MGLNLFWTALPRSCPNTSSHMRLKDVLVTSQNIPTSCAHWVNTIELP